MYVVENDPTVVPIGVRHARWRQGHIPDSMAHNQTRVVLRANAGMCLYAYAVTYEGARKILATISLNSPSQAVDTSISAFCRNRLMQGVSCFGMYPPVMSSHRFAGPRSRDSDLNEKQDTWHPEFTTDIVYSAIQNIPRLVSGASTVLAQWPNDVLPPEMSREGRSTITGEVKNWDFREMEETNVEGINS